MTVPNAFAVSLYDAAQANAIGAARRRLLSMQRAKREVDEMIDVLEHLNLNYPGKISRAKTPPDIYDRLIELAYAYDIPRAPKTWRSAVPALEALFDCQAPILRDCARCREDLAQLMEAEDAATVGANAQEEARIG